MKPTDYDAAIQFENSPHIYYFKKGRLLGYSDGTNFLAQNNEFRLQVLRETKFDVVEELAGSAAYNIFLNACTIHHFMYHDPILGQHFTRSFDFRDYVTGPCRLDYWLKVKDELEKTYDIVCCGKSGEEQPTNIEISKKKSYKAILTLEDGRIEECYFIQTRYSIVDITDENRYTPLDTTIYFKERKNV